MSSRDDADPEHTSPQHATRDQLRAIAHPLRLQILERVGRRGTARAADLAGDLGIPANSVSYHLRILARGGAVIEAAEAARDKRDRVWKLAQTSFRHGVGDEPADDLSAQDPEYFAASYAASIATFDWMPSAWAAEVALQSRRAPGHPDEPGPGALFATTLRISPEQASELSDLVSAKIDEFNRLNRDEHGADLPRDPDSAGEARDFRVLFALVGARDGHSPRQDS